MTRDRCRRATIGNKVKDMMSVGDGLGGVRHGVARGRARMRVVVLWNLGNAIDRNDRLAIQ